MPQTKEQRAYQQAGYVLQLEQAESLKMFMAWDGSFRSDVIQSLAEQRNRLVAATFGYNRAKAAAT